MIKFDSKNINDMNFGDRNVIKVYRNGAVVYYKLSGESPTPEYQVCFAVVDDISQYSETEFEDVYDKATDKWYKLNNLNQYEEYGVYGSGRTSCEGSTSRLPQGYTEVEYVQNNTQGAYLNLGVKLYETIGNSYQITARYKSQYMSNWSSGEYLQTIINSEGVSSPYYGMAFRYAYNTHVLELAGVDKSDITWTNADNGDGTSALTISSNSTAHADQVPLGLFASYQGNYTSPYRWSNTTIYSMQITLNNELVRDLVPCIRDNDSMVGMYDLVNDVFYYPPNYRSYQLVAGDPTTPTECVTTYKGKLTIDDGYEYEWNDSSWVNLGETSGSSTEYPKYYEEKSAPLDNLSFNTMEEAQTYAYNNCVYDGMLAIIDGLRYYFDSTSENGWVEYSQDYSQEYFTMVVTSGGNIKWSGSTTDNKLSYSKDNGETWNTADGNTTIAVVEGDKILWKGTPTPQTSYPRWGIGKFSGDTNVRYSVEGNAMSLLFGDDFKNQTSLEGKTYALYGLFSGNKNVTSAENLSLPATTLVQSCYQSMFHSCTSLTTAPELPATTLADYCYSSMFYGCTSLTEAPQLLTTTLASSCYRQMFYNCTSLSSIKCLATDISASSCTNNWVSGVAASGTFTKAASMNDWTSGTSGIPNGWTVVDA